MRPKKNLKFKVYDEVITVKDHDDGGNEVFPIGTKGIIIRVDSEAEYPYKVVAKDGDGDFWFYNDEMLKEDNEEHTDNVEKLDIEAYLIAGDVLEKTKGYEEKIKEVIYYLYSFINY